MPLPPLAGEAVSEVVAVRQNSEHANHIDHGNQ